jgi:GT2 family glycosyltransferase
MTAPALAVVLTTRQGWAPLAATLRCLAAQTVAERIELVLVSLSSDPPGEPPPEVARLAGHRVVSLPGAGSVAEANAAGALVSRAPVVAFGEDHSFPLPGWAQALLERHEEPWAVVGPVVRNANPRTATSWADFLLGYAPFAEGGGGEAEGSPGHNSAYKRELLERHADGLVTAMAAEWLFHGRLRAAGERIYLEPRAITRHVNFAVPRVFLAAKFKAAHSGARVRAASWPWRRRLVYCGGSAILPALRLARLLRGLTPAQRTAMPLIRVAPMLLAGLVVDAAGQAAGFVSRTAEPARDADLELERIRFIPAADRAELP